MVADVQKMMFAQDVFVQNYKNIVNLICVLFDHLTESAVNAVQLVQRVLLLTSGVNVRKICDDG